MPNDSKPLFPDAHVCLALHSSAISQATMLNVHQNLCLKRLGKMEGIHTPRRKKERDREKEIETERQRQRKREREKN
jgi:hypothetical protein